MRETLDSSLGTLLTIYSVLVWATPFIIPYHWATLYFVDKFGLRTNALKSGEQAFVNAARFFYGLINPIIYLIIFQSMPFHQSASIKLLNNLAGIYLCLYWCTLMVSRGVIFRHSSWVSSKAFLSIRTYFGLGLIGIFLAKDLYFRYLSGTKIHSPATLLGEAWFLTFVFIPLFSVPALLLYSDIRQQSGNNRIEPKFLSRILFTTMALLTIVFLISSFIPVPRFYLHRKITKDKEMIKEAAAEFGVKADLITAIIIVGNNSHSNIAKYLAKDRFSEVWAWDNKNHQELTKPFDISVGLCQIKPSTAFEYLYLNQSNKPDLADLYDEIHGYYAPSLPATLVYKEGRDNLSRPDADYVMPNTFLPIGAPLRYEFSRKTIYDALHTERDNIRFAAFILRMIQEHWKAKGFDIVNRPDIIATIYNIGFKNSHPKANPQPNDFGKAVAEEMQEMKAD